MRKPPPPRAPVPAFPRAGEKGAGENARPLVGVATELGLLRQRCDRRAGRRGIGRLRKATLPQGRDPELRQRFVVAMASRLHTARRRGLRSRYQRPAELGRLAEFGPSTGLDRRFLLQELLGGSRTIADTCLEHCCYFQTVAGYSRVKLMSIGASDFLSWLIADSSCVRGVRALREPLISGAKRSGGARTAHLPHEALGLCASRSSRARAARA